MSWLNLSLINGTSSSSTWSSRWKLLLTQNPFASQLNSNSILVSRFLFLKTCVCSVKTFFLLWTCDQLIRVANFFSRLYTKLLAKIYQKLKIYRYTKLAIIFSSKFSSSSTCHIGIKYVITNGETNSCSVSLL